jgi:hypothetical protein
MVVLSSLSLFCPSCHGRPVFSSPSCLYFPDCRLSSCPVQLSWPGFPAPVVLPGSLSLALLSPTLSSPMSCPCCHVLGVLSSLSCPLYPLETVLSRLFYPVQAVLTCPSHYHTSCHVPDVLSQVYCHGCTVMVVPSGCPVPDVLSLLSYSGNPVLSILSYLYYPNCLLQRSWPCFLVSDVLSQLSFPRCPPPTVVSQLSGPSVLVPSYFFPHVLSFLSCLYYPVLSDCPVYSVLKSKVENKFWRKKLVISSLLLRRYWAD